MEEGNEEEEEEEEEEIWVLFKASIFFNFIFNWKFIGLNVSVGN